MHWINPNSLPETSGTVSQLLYNAHGDADGFLLDNRRQVHLPPHLSAELLRKVKVGDKVRIRGVMPRGADVLAAVALSGPHGEILDEGPDGRPPRDEKPRARKPTEISGRVRMTLHAPKGEVCGAVLESGEIVRFPPRGNEALGAWLGAGSEVTVWGDLMTVRGQKIVDMSDIAHSSRP